MGPGMFVPEPPLVGAFVVASLVLNLTPGLDMTYVVGVVVRWRTRAGVCAALGIALGSLCHVLLAAAGLSALVAASPALMHALTLAGAAYLVWSGVAMIRDAGPTGDPDQAAVDGLTGGHQVRRADAPAATTTVIDTPPTLARVTLRGALVNLLNVKVIVFYLSFIPQFVRTEAGPTWQQVAFFGVLFNLLGTTVLCLVAMLTGWASRSLLASPRAQFRARRACGVTLIVMALLLVSTRLLA